MPLPTPAREGSITLRSGDGLELVADEWNAAAQPVLLLLPCGGELRRVWQKVVPSLAPEVRARWRVVAPDHRGHGDSGRAPIYRFDDLLGDVTAWLRHCSGEPVVIAGGSIGGALGLVAAGEGAKVHGIVLLDVPTVPVLDRAQSEGQRLLAARDAGRPAAMRVDPAFVESGFIEDVFRDPDRWRRAAVRLQIPTLLIGGARGVIGEHAPPLYREHVPHGEFASLETGHLVARDAPAETASLLSRFLLAHWPTAGR
jgi:pimeloyl-ACP methyl ester carboxylesterase